MNLGERRHLIFVLSGILLAAILIGGIFWLWADEDEVVIRRKLSELVENVNKGGEEAPFVILMGTQEIMKTFSEEPEIDLGPPAGEGLDREELQAFVYQARNNLTTIEIELVEVEVAVADDRDSAEVEVLARSVATHQGQTYRDSRRFHLWWIQEDGKWVIHRAELIDRVELEGSL